MRRSLARAAGAVATAGVSWLGAAAPAVATDDQYASTTWEFTPGNGSGASCTLFAESRVMDTPAGSRDAFVHFRLVDEDPRCLPFLVLLQLDYVDVHGNQQHIEADGQEGARDVSLRASDVATDPEAVGEVFVGYTGCDVPRDCLTSRVVQPK